MNLTIWTGIREYITAEIWLAILRDRVQQRGYSVENERARIAELEAQVTRMETSVREAL